MPKGVALQPLAFLDLLVDVDGLPPCDPPDACQVCRLFVAPLDRIGELYRAAPVVWRQRRGGS